MKTLELTLEEALEVSKAISNKHRMKILRILSERPHNVNELAEKLDIPFSTTAVNVKKLEDVKLISTELVPGRGTQKVNTINFDRIAINLYPPEKNMNDNSIEYEKLIGDYVDCNIEPGCGLVDENDYIGMQDDPRTFYEPERMRAQLLFFRAGYVEYRFPNRIPDDCIPSEICLSAEICSEAPNHKLDWPSDITLWINDREVGTWTSPSDFGGERGILTPNWWLKNYTQYGILKSWKVNEQGCFIDGVKVTDEVTIYDLAIEDQIFISFRLGVKKDAVNAGGMNLFGPRFGNHEQGLKLKINYKKKDDKEEN